MAPLNPLTTTTVDDLYPTESQAYLTHPTVQHKLYKERFVGLAVLVLLNIIVSWDWLTFSAVSSTASQFFQLSESAINWLSTGFLFAFVIASPFTIWALHRGPRTSILSSAVLIFVGNWIRYAGTRSGAHGSFPVVVLGQIIIGFAQPFVLAAPTRFSDLWFPEKGLFGRVSATAVASLANPLGGALGQLIGPFWASEPKDIPHMVLFTAIVSCVACLPTIFVRSKPPTPASNSANVEMLNITASLKSLKQNKAFALIFVAFGVYVGFFNAVSSLINQIFEPYGFTETDAGIAGAILIFVGLGVSAVTSLYVDHTKRYLPTIKWLVPLIAIGYILLVFMPETRTVAGPYITCAILGAASFSLLPCALEYLVEITYPASPEVSSTICWTGGQLLGAVFILLMDALKGGLSGQPKDSMKSALIFQAVISCLAVPCVFALSHCSKGNIGLGRRGVENAVTIT
ncbi:major facilitator superfamily transporter [Aureobasidium namibiae CBS 147.97]|uniref:Major facilitator superfamily transporter n=1 Tax=Aureobasidium namibiae CBS 147.97 TaxID=1043004 RepID=A0A074WGD0_9PEZI|nr:major facilitator superfamily transporter [Aureobasidium namibiae CBS 147.97]KEQ68942.1 major facilitator superfamily transporter [Aureobasidium namibiae CBS 147.97]